MGNGGGDGDARRGHQPGEHVVEHHPERAMADLLPVIKQEMKEYLADRKAGRLDILGEDDREGATRMTVGS